MGCSTLVIGRNHEKEKMKQEIERKEEEIKNLGEKVREDEKEKERNSFCRSHWKVGNSKARRYLRNMKKKKPIPFSHKFPRAEPLSLHLPEMLSSKPNDLLTAERFLMVWSERLPTVLRRGS
ncbi:mitogen-activated protein kinase 8-like [Brassica napus]|uniref:mitogen-activated protein kinase 8-like n=1 Tax=Brassica oleracea var. oleracea TaxID=109376 RepID=UPI0006A6A7A0|nr:PREDICTED: mitogen-activated protein kinase 8-like [Brassica oleracea var. oleracea]XP_013586303.1 PREDICTED: mitogen-activated protein kinase 8-like [Brassica oleracea var. oleracea]XP_013586309.1 PREDICTED: mitogen-activated protein kinase 8-like [Brassica oleracea var. oleracea]XP_013586315.1 PREDICTED: mitogen-activated protein kinase 8-like [Brassica oleracea var. oleracea]XP_013586323.1 PREDICTED: mitogen-activated protein kinase 8-like [Brassica oleracea var. oleracea]XP_048601097.1 